MPIAARTVDNGTLTDYDVLVDNITVDTIAGDAQVVSGTETVDDPVVGRPVMQGGRASAVAPTAVSTDGDVVIPWLTLRGGTVVEGGRAHDETIAGNPVLVGAYAEADGDVVAVADADVVRMLADTKGRQWVRNIPNVVSTGITSVPGTAAAAYAAGDTVGTIITVSAAAARVTGGTGMIRRIFINDHTDIGGLLTLFFFRSTVTLAADNAVWAVSDADMDACVDIVPVSLQDFGTSRQGIAIPLSYYDCAATSLFLGIRTEVAVATGWAVNTLKYNIQLELD